MAIAAWTRQEKQDREARDLAPYAMRSADSRGRVHAERPDELRTSFERDRDRITHCTAFRRLMYKTQVFLNSEGDPYRTRLSHSLEVCQVARSVGTALRLNEPLCEALALAHDLGHPPFGHRGEWALDELMQAHGGFRHNVQVLRVVDTLERRTPEYSGLNLTREVRESLLKHEAADDWPDKLAPRPERPLLEAQVVDLADSTAYNKHDLEDGLLAGMFREQDLHAASALWREATARVEQRHPELITTEDHKLRVVCIANDVIGTTIEDLIHSSLASLDGASASSPAQVQDTKRNLITHSAGIAAQVGELQQFLYEHFYRHEHLQRFLEYARRVLRALFDAYRAQPDELPAWYRAWAIEVGLERAICDYLAGMTDRFAQQEVARLVAPDLGGFPRSG